jgi:UDP-N-acetylglucosamine 2-epimerase (non-hydrolysing)
LKKIGIILGTRPEAIKLIPVYQALKKFDTVKPILISTGQHKKMLDQIFDFFEVEPQVELRVMKDNQTLAGLSSLLFSEIDKVVNQYKLDMLVVQGDTTSAMIGSMIGFYNRVAVAHVEAGLRTYDKFSPFPEEINRRIIGLTADFHFAPTKMAAEILRKEKANNVFEVGNTVIDSLTFAKSKVDKQINSYSSKLRFNTESNLVLITGHRRESFGGPFEQICLAILELSKKYPEMSFVYPVHLNPNVQGPVKMMLKDAPNIHLIEPIPYDEMVYLMSNAYLILTDSGGIQEEAPSLNVPVIVMRDKTERPEGIEAGCSVLSGTDKTKIIELFDEIHHSSELREKMKAAINPYGDGKSAIRIAQILSEA